MKKIIAVCGLCKKEFLVLEKEITRGRGKFCSRSCAGKVSGTAKKNAGKDNPNWKGGRSDYDRIKKQRILHPDRTRARKAVYNAIKSGAIKKEPCAICGNENSQAHHTNYENRLEVIWLCQKHHREAHK